MWFSFKYNPEEKTATQTTLRQKLRLAYMSMKYYPIAYFSDNPPLQVYKPLSY